MQLSAQTHFSQGWNTRLLKDIASLGTDMIRDAVPWNLVETKPGVYNFDQRAAKWVDEALAAGLEVTLTFNPNNALYDGGNSAYTDAGRAAFARFVVETLKAFPGVTAVEIGNEYNTNNFLKGPVASHSKEERAEFYTKLVAAVDKALEAAHLDVEIIGASTHSIPVDYFADLASSGALGHVDSVSIHPYSTEPEQFAAQLALLRQTIGADTEIRVTEFGDKFENLAEAPAFLAKMVSVMAAAGVTSANWYAFARQSYFPNMELWDPQGDKATPAGVTFKLLEGLLAGGDAVTRVEAGSHTYFYAFGSDAAILWGEPRGLTLGNGVTAYDLAGRRITDLTNLSPDTPVILRTTSGDIADKVSFDASPLLADSYHDFDLTGSGPWTYLAENGLGKDIELETMGGGHRSGEPWNPYMGLASLRPFQISSDTLTPADFTPKKDRPTTEFATVERFTAAEAGKVVIRGHWDVNDRTDDGVVLTIEVNGRAIFTKVIFDKAGGHVFDLELTDIMLRPGDTIDFEIATRGNAAGDVTSRRIQIFDQELLAELGFEINHNPPPVDPEEPPVDPEPPATGGTNPVRLKGSFSDDLLVGGLGNDKLSGLGGDDVLRGNAGNDQLDGDGSDDLLDGGAGKDQLIGGSGADILIGGGGNDQLSGGSGADTFVFADGFGTDMISDFGPGDRIDLSAIAGLDDFSDLTINYTAKRAVITLGDDKIMLTGLNAGSLDASDFIF